MTLKELEAFHLAATLGSFALAAQRAHVTQSSLSKRIAELEIWAGAELFDRSGRKAQLTEAGQRLLPIASQMLGLKQGARAALNTSSSLSGTCRFGVSELGALTWLPRFVARMQMDHPNLVLKLHVDLGRQLERQVMRGELDCAVVPGPPEKPHIASHMIEKVHIAWMAAPGRVRPGTVLNAEELSSHPVVTMTEGSGLTQAFDTWATGQGLHMQRIVASNSLMAIVGLTIADVGLSFLPQAFMRPWIDRGELIEFRSSPPLPALQFCFLHREDDRRAMLFSLRQCVAEVAQYAMSAVFSHGSC